MGSEPYATASVDRGKAKSTGKKTLVGVSVRPSQNGGFTVDHDYRLARGPDGMGYCPPETFTFESQASMLAHLSKLFGDGESKKA